EPAADVARINVLLPPDARLYVDDVPSPRMGERVSFDTPRLEPGRKYAYSLKVAGARNGQRYEDSRRITFSVGREVTGDFNGPAEGPPVAGGEREVGKGTRPPAEGPARPRRLLGGDPFSGSDLPPPERPAQPPARPGERPAADVVEGGAGKAPPGGPAQP